MSEFSFVHAADLHLGSPFQGLAVKDPEIAARFADATRRAFTGLVDETIARKAAFLVIAGDVYDGEWKDSSVGLFFNREVSRLTRAGIPVVFLRGNHDAASVVTKTVKLPEHVHQFSTRSPQTIRLDELRVALHGQGFAERSANDNLALRYPAPVPGYVNIGVIHTSLTGRPPHAVYAPCSLADLKGQGYDYWALGHVHDFEIVATDPHIVFPGNLQGRNVRETGAKGAVEVRVVDGRIERVERIVVDAARWASLAVDVTGCADRPAILDRISALLSPIVEETGDRLLALRVTLAGASPFRRALVSDRITLGEEIQAACHHLHADIWLEKLRLDLTDPATAQAPASDLDIEAMLAAVLAAPERTAEAEAIMREIAAKLPPGLGAGEAPLGDPETLLAEARDLLIARAGDDT